MIAKPLLLALMIAYQPSVEKTQFSHGYETGQTLKYDLEFSDVQAGGDTKGRASVDLAIGEKTDKGMKATLKPVHFSMAINGNESDMTGQVGEASTVIDRFGMPEQINMNDAAVVHTLTLVLAFLPDKELAEGERFDFDWKSGESYYKGSGQFVGDEKVGETSFQKLTLKSVLHPGSDSEAAMTVNVLFDKTKKQVYRSSGEAEVENTTYKFTLQRK